MRSKLLFFDKSSLQHIAWLPMFGLVPFTTNGQVCLSTEDVQTTQVVQQTSAAQSNNQIEINTGHIDLSSEEGVQFSGEVEFRYGDRSIIAKSAYFDRANQRMEVIGTATYSDPSLTVFGEDAEVDTENEEVLFRVAGFEIPDETARGSANEIKIRGDRTVSLLSVNFTTCPVDKVDWEFLASELDLDASAGFGTARDVKLRFKGLPILYAPYITFPIDDQRKSGFLTPHFGQSDRTGLDLEIPYYLNLSPNYDMTLKPRYLGKRGLQLNTEFRYLRPKSGGQLNLEYLPDDDKLDRARRYFNLNHESSFGTNWHLITSIQDVSDDSYFEDLGGSLSVTSQTHLDRYLQIAYQTSRWSFLTRIQGYQTIDPRIESSERPYERIPQLLFDGDWSRNRLGIRVTSELVNFDRDLGTTGWRFDSNQELSFSVNKAGMFLIPAIALRQTNYWLNDATSDGQDSISRTLPIASLDAGLTLERSTNRLGNWIQTLEPRVLYVHIPYKNQALLPVFDTIEPDFNLVQLFRKYQFLGPDRVADADKISFGVTTRLIDQKNGQEKLTATLGQTRYRSTEGTVLPDSLPSIS
ncbi:MAG: LPS assembly protein LptD, partial [Pseudomonadota bacterium]|nr:LPS assembly protein LptD [Pseudomonadota bacterium]